MKIPLRRPGANEGCPKEEEKKNRHILGGIRWMNVAPPTENGPNLSAFDGVEHKHCFLKAFLFNIDGLCIIKFPAIFIAFRIIYAQLELRCKHCGTHRCHIVWIARSRE